MFAILVFLSLQTPSIEQTAGIRLTGIVIDVSGAAVVGATVIVERGEARSLEIETGPNGRFIADLSVGEYVIRAMHPGFVAVGRVVAIAGGETSEFTVLVLQPAGISDTVTVTATRGEAQFDSHASTSVLTSAELFSVGAATIDDALRNTPGFGLFRRSSSRVANPTTQGVTLRGVSGSGASRTLVLADGLPLNDPFGGWVYWNRIPSAAIDRVEVVRGAVGDLYGADAVGGVIQILTLDPNRSRLRAVFDVDSHETVRGSFFAGGQRSGWNGTLAGEVVSTEGYIVVPEVDRGSVDVPANSEYQSAIATLGFDSGGSWRATGRAAVYSEDRSNGTPVQVNDTDWRQFSGEFAGAGGSGAGTIRIAGGSQGYQQAFSAIASDRNSESIVRQQHIPSTFWNISGQWVQSLREHTVIDRRRRTAQ